MLSVRMSYTSFAGTLGVHGFVVSQRLKRIERIQRKLERESVRLSQLQDIGGVRVIVPTLTDQAKLAEHAVDYLQNVVVIDYVTAPKTTGYRAIHHVVKRAGRLIEVQLRTEMQHEWADRIEQVGRDTGTELKWLTEPIPEAVEYAELLPRLDRERDESGEQGRLLMEDDDG